MTTRDAFEKTLSRLNAIRADPDEPGAAEALRAALAANSNLLVARAAEIIGEWQLPGYTDRLADAFGRFLVDSARRDPTCAAKYAIADTLNRLEVRDAELFLQGIRHVQMEPKWGGQEDTAPPLRAVCAIGLARSDPPDTLLELARLLADPQADARIGAIRAVAYAARPGGAPLLWYKAHTGDEEAAVMYECFSAVLALEPEAALVLVGERAAGGDAAQAAMAVAQGTAAQQQINYTRSNEQEADRIGISYLASAGFDPNAMSSFFETMNRHTGLAGQNIPEFILTHPVTTNRIAEARDRAKDYPVPKAGNEVPYLLARERSRVVAAEADNDLRTYYEGQIAEGHDGVGEKYGEALTELGHGEATDAVAVLHGLHQRYDGNPTIAAALGQAQMSAGATDAALATFADALRLSPRNVPLTVRYAEALMRAGRAREAHVMLLDLFNNVAPTPEQIRLTALAASAAGDTGDAYFYMSEYHIANGNLPLSMQQLELALAAPNLTGVQRQRFQARLDEVREAISKDRKRKPEEPARG